MAALRYALRLLPADLYYYNYIAQPWDRDRRIRRCLTASDDTLAQPGACCPTTLLRYRYVKSERGLSRPHHNGGMTADFVAHVRSLEKTMFGANSFAEANIDGDLTSGGTTRY